MQLIDQHFSREMRQGTPPGKTSFLFTYLFIEDRGFDYIYHMF